MPVDMAAIAAGFALLAPVYALLFQIQRDIGALSADHETVAERLDEIEAEVTENSETLNENPSCP